MTGLDVLPESDPTGLLRYRDGIYAADVLATAVIEFRLFDYLSISPKTLEEVCAHYQWAERPADVLITLCKAKGLLEESAEGELRVTTLAKEFCCESSPWDLTKYYDSLRDRPVVGDFVRVLKTGKPAHWSGLDEADDDWHESMLQEDFARTFTAAMDCRGVFLGKKLADVVAEWISGSGSLLDVGGGSGVYACAMAANNPELKCVVLEQEPVDAIAREQIEKRGLTDRVDVEIANMFTAEWPSGHDVHLFSNVMHDWDTPDILTLLRRSRAALQPGARVLIHETFLNGEKTGPLPVAEYSCILAHSTQGRCYSVWEMTGYLEEAGFEVVAHRDTGGDRGVIVGVAVE
tara:strand:- start:823 stop:1866 length:1044 start_codon:yes stop_codon:yes gene_type:complete